MRSDFSSNISSLVKSTYEEHLCVLAMTSSERGTQFHLLASYFLDVIRYLLIYFQVNTGVSYLLDYVEDTCDGGPLCSCFNPF